jgi:hypothetical protein
MQCDAAWALGCRRCGTDARVQHACSMHDAQSATHRSSSAAASPCVALSMAWYAAKSLAFRACIRASRLSMASGLVWLRARRSCVFCTARFITSRTSFQFASCTAPGSSLARTGRYQKVPEGTGALSGAVEALAGAATDRMAFQSSAWIRCKTWTVRGRRRTPWCDYKGADTRHNRKRGRHGIQRHTLV